MLYKSQITDTVIHSDAWFAGRLAKFTSSEISLLMGEKGLGEAGGNYVFRKVGELLTGMSAKKEISTDATEHGHIYEPENLREFGKKMGVDFLVTQKLIRGLNEMEGSTPDAMFIHNHRSTGEGYDVYTVEAKCPMSPEKFIRLWNCKTPFDVKRANRTYFYQAIHQMRVAGALRGYLSVYNPFFKAGKINIIEFKQTDVALAVEFNIMDTRIKQAIALFETQRDLMINSN